MNLKFWKKRGTDVGSDAYAPHEEIDAKRTSKLGYFFLILMVIFGVVQGNNLLRSIENTVATPERNSTCLNELAGYLDISNGNYYSSYYYGYGRNTGSIISPNYERNVNTQECQFSAREIEKGINIAYSNIESQKEEIESIRTSIQSYKSRIQSAETDRRTILKEYNTSLFEDIADAENAIFDQNSLQGRISANDSSLKNLKATVLKNELRISNLELEIVSILTPYKSIIQSAYDEYNRALIVREFKQFLLALLLIAPMFFFVWRRYHIAKNNRSEYAVIWGGAVATVGFMFAQILLVFVYQIIPKGIIEAIFEFFSAIKIFVTILYWLGFILVPLFFGFLIYLIQKKFYNKRAVMKRALKSGHCPNCSLKFSKDMNNCPVCGYRLKSECKTCHSMSMDGGAFCEVCGVRRTEVTPPSQPSVNNTTEAGSKNDVDVTEMTKAKPIHPNLN